MNMDTDTLALIQLDHPAIQEYKRLGLAVQTEVEALVIATQDDLDRATMRLGEIVQIPKRATKFRLEVTAPFREHVETVNKAVMDVVAPIAAAEAMLRSKWQAAKKRLDAEAAEALRREGERQRRIDAEAHAATAGGRMAEAAARGTGD